MSLLLELRISQLVTLWVFLFHFIAKERRSFTVQLKRGIWIGYKFLSTIKYSLKKDARTGYSDFA